MKNTPQMQRLAVKRMARGIRLQRSMKVTMKEYEQSLNITFAR